MKVGKNIMSENNKILGLRGMLKYSLFYFLKKYFSP